MVDPINIRHLLQLNEYGIDPSQIAFGEVTMESEKYVACNYKACGLAEVLVIDLERANQPLQLSISVESAIMHPRRTILGLKCCKTLRIIDLSSNYVVMEHISKDAIIFWRWIDEATIGFITHDGSVFHWTLEATSMPTRMFVIDRKVSYDFRVSDYRVNADHKICAVVGQAKNSRASPIIQLFDAESGTSLLFKGHALRFAQMTLGNNCLPSNLLVYCTASSSPRNHILKIIDISSGIDDNIQSHNAPPAISPTQGVAYLATALGYLHIFDVESGLELHSCAISNDRIFSPSDLSGGGFIGISRRGNVFSVSMNEEAMIDHVAQWNKELARKLAQRWSVRPNKNRHPVPIPISESRRLDSEESPWKITADKLARERDEMAARNRELERKYRKALMMMGRADQLALEHGCSS